MRYLPKILVPFPKTTFLELNSFGPKTSRFGKGKGFSFYFEKAII